jgi:hypothetical protein
LYQNTASSSTQSSPKGYQGINTKEGKIDFIHGEPINLPKQRMTLVLFLSLLINKTLVFFKQLSG